MPKSASEEDRPGARLHGPLKSRQQRRVKDRPAQIVGTMHHGHNGNFVVVVNCYQCRIFYQCRSPVGLRQLASEKLRRLAAYENPHKTDNAFQDFRNAGSGCRVSTSFCWSRAVAKGGSFTARAEERANFFGYAGYDPAQVEIALSNGGIAASA